MLWIDRKIINMCDFPQSLSLVFALLEGNEWTCGDMMSYEVLKNKEW